jgi:hypothetical protein
MKIKDFVKVDEQDARCGNHIWSVSRLIALSQHLPIMEVKLDHMSVWYKYETMPLRDMVMHMKAVLNADLSCPIILDEDGEILDGRHRVMKALLEGKETILAVRFDENPPPCRIKDDKES